MLLSLLLLVHDAAPCPPCTDPALVAIYGMLLLACWWCMLLFSAFFHTLPSHGDDYNSRFKLIWNTINNTNLSQCFLGIYLGATKHVTMNTSNKRKYKQPLLINRLLHHSCQPVSKANHIPLRILVRKSWLSHWWTIWSLVAHFRYRLLTILTFGNSCLTSIQNTFHLVDRLWLTQSCLNIWRRRKPS